MIQSCKKIKLLTSILFNKIVSIPKIKYILNKTTIIKIHNHV